MSATTDFDRALAAWLDEGPRRAPDRPIDLAIEHARRRPRRRDPLGFLRPDVMAARRGGAFAQPALVFAIVGLLLVGAVGAVVVGSLRDDPSVLPGPTSSPTVPSPTPVPTPSLPATFDVTITDEVGNETAVSVMDTTGYVVGADAADPTGRDQVEGLLLTNESPVTLIVSWVNCPTDSGNVLRIDSAVKTMTLERGRCLGDTVAVSKAIRLTFSQPVEASAVETSIIDER